MPIQHSPHDTARIGLAGIVCCFLLVQTGCHLFSNGGTKDAAGYREDERALIEIGTQTILDLEKAKDYAAIYDTKASRDYRSRVSKERFLSLTHCVETHLGDWQQRNSKIEPTRHQLSGKKGTFVDRVELKIERSKARITERFEFIDDGLGYRVNTFRWLADNNDFAQCLQSIGQTPVTTMPETQKVVEPEPKQLSPEDDPAQSH